MGHGEKIPQRIIFQTTAVWVKPLLGTCLKFTSTYDFVQEPVLRRLQHIIIIIVVIITTILLSPFYRIKNFSIFLSILWYQVFQKCSGKYSTDPYTFPEGDVSLNSLILQIGKSRHNKMKWSWKGKPMRWGLPSLAVSEHACASSPVAFLRYALQVRFILIQMILPDVLVCRQNCRGNL